MQAACHAAHAQRRGETDLRTFGQSGAFRPDPVLAAHPGQFWNFEDTPAEDILWTLFAAGWVILFLGAWSFGMRELLGIEQARACSGVRLQTSRLKTGLLYRWVPHPMYVGVLLGVWATPRMSFGHLLLALALTAYVRVAMRYEERDLLHRFGASYRDYRGMH